MEPLSRAKSGFTLIEVLASSLIVAVTAGGTLMAFVAAARMSSGVENPDVLEAAGYGQQMVEGLRNLVAQDDTSLTTAPPIWINAAAPLPGFPAFPPPVPGAGSESIYSPGPVKRCYRITQQDCDGVLGLPNCQEVEAHVCWGPDLTGCQCP